MSLPQTPDAVDVTYVLDRNFIEPTVISALSLLHHRPADLTLRLIVTGEAPELAPIRERMQRRFPDATIEASIDPSLFFDVPTRGHVSPATLARLALPRLLDRPTLYIDGDTMVCRDVGEVFATPRHGQPIAACKDIGIQRALWQRKRGGFASGKLRQHLRDLDAIAHLVDGETFFNAGVILFDLPRIRDLGLAEKMGDVAGAVALRQQYNLRFNDQNWLNLVFRDRAAWLDPAWNALWGNTKTARNPFPPEARAAYAASRDTPGIVHFTGRTKPWKVRNPWLLPKRWPWIFRYKAFQKTCGDVLNG